MYTYVHMYMYIYVYIYNGVITSGNEIGKSISRIPNLASEIGALCHIFRDIGGFRKVDCHKRERRVTDSASKTPAACAHQRPRRPINGVVHPADACLVCDLWQLIPKATDVTVCNAFVGCNGRNNNSLQQLLHTSNVAYRIYAGEAEPRVNGASDEQGKLPALSRRDHPDRRAHKD